MNLHRKSQKFSKERNEKFAEGSKILVELLAQKRIRLTHTVRVDHTGFNNLLDFDDRAFTRFTHGIVEVAGGHPSNKAALFDGIEDRLEDETMLMFSSGQLSA